MTLPGSKNSLRTNKTKCGGQRTKSKSNSTVFKQHMHRFCKFYYNDVVNNSIINTVTLYYNVQIIHNVSLCFVLIHCMYLNIHV